MLVNLGLYFKTYVIIYMQYAYNTIVYEYNMWIS